jgi:4-hydroxymandelate oxidase
MEDLARLLTVDDFEAAAKRVLAPEAWDYFRSGADAERTLTENRAAYSRRRIWPRVLVDVSTVQTGIELFGTQLASPILIAPTAYHRLAHPDGEPATARAAATAKTIFVLSTLATTRIEEVITNGPRWFQLYVHRDRGLTRSLVERAVAAGHQAIVLTVDTPILGRRLADERNRFILPAGLTMANLVGDGDPIAGDGSALAAWFAARHDASLTFADVAWLKSIAPLPLLVKGILRPDDAQRALDAGADGIIVSNHGGRQLDGVPATPDALPGVVEKIAGRLPVLVDGGIRWGTDVLTALALGARAVLVGRPILWGLAVAGELGVSRVLSILHSELARAMALAGCPNIAAITRDVVS